MIKMPQFMKSTIDINSLEEIKQYIERKDVVEVHLTGILFGVTIFKDRKKPDTLCIAFHRKIKCTNSINEVIEAIKKEVKDSLPQSLKAVIFMAKTQRNQR